MPPPNTPRDARDMSDDLVPAVFDLYGAQALQTLLPVATLPHPELIDFRGLTYMGTVDENLICPICRVALVDPVDTDCNHTFCRECIAQALSHNEVCPIDRSTLSPQAQLKPSHKIVIHQLDALLVRCICCEAGIPRSMLQNHVEKYCADALVKCSGQACEEAVKRRFFHRGCLHYDVTCPDCKEVHQEIDVNDHREHACTERRKECEHCNTSILRCKESDHFEECPDILASCKWAGYGCQYVSKRRNLHLHTDECNFKLVGPMADMLKKEINNLQGEVRVLNEKNQGQERRIKFLESGLKDSDRHVDYAEFPAPSQLSEGGNPEPLDSANEYLLSLIEAQESRISQLSAGMTELEAKQTMMLFNETIPIKNELAEMRSSQQVVSMHVRWLLNFRRQENQKRFGAGGGGGGPGPSSGSDTGGSGGDTPLPRRLSDSMRDLITKL